MIHRALSKSQDGLEHVGHEVESPNAVLFPWFSVLAGIFAYYIISRYANGVPYTAVMFVIGALMGYSSNSSGNAIVESIGMWLGIDGEVIILAFLPGLLFLDSYNANVYLFRQAFSQLLMFAFPMVLAGTSLTALVAYYVLPYGWSFDLCMTFGSILAATDPVAVAVLLNDLGAPARLKIHIAGESLLNDGSAVVFFHIFSLRFFNEIGIENFGENAGWLRGIVLFFRLSLGGACIGLLFGIGLVTLLFNFNRRLSQEENVIQVTSTITIAYLSFFTSEVVCHCSGIIAVVICGLVTKSFGDTLLNDSHLTHDFWHITEHLLNSILFTLGGAVWITRVGSTDWIYLLLLFGLVVVIRFALFFAFFPITSRMGVGQSWKEAVFMSYSGLRGAVGIALALLLSAEVFKHTESESVLDEIRNKYREFADTCVGLVGGVALLTLVVNGPTCGPLLERLGLVAPTETRKKVVAQYLEHMRQNTLVELLSLLAERRFQDIDFGVVREHVSPLRDLTEDELSAGVERHRRMYPDVRPNLSNIRATVSSSKNGGEEKSLPFRGSARTIQAKRAFGPKNRPRETVYDYNALLDAKVVLEERSIFLNLLRREYHLQLKRGELDSRGFIPYCLLQSLDIAEEAAAKGLPLNDWAASQTAGGAILKAGDRTLHAYRVGGLWKRREGDLDFHVIRTCVLQNLSFIKAHLGAQETFKAEFSSCTNANLLTLAEKTVIDESREQVSRADSAISNFDAEDVNTVKSQYVCQILLHKSVNYLENLATNGLMTEKEAGEFLKKYDLELRTLRVSSELKIQVSPMSRRRIAPELGTLDPIESSGSE